jgi:hypothetical protein
MLIGIGMLLGAVGVIGLVYGLIMRSRAGRITDAPFVKTGEAAAKGTAAASPKGAISAEGNVTCPEPLVAPVSGKTCLYYEVKVTASWKDGDTTRSKELSHDKRAARFGIDDGSGPVWIDAREGGDFEPEEEKSETKSTSLIGGITGQDLMFGQLKVSTGMLSLGTKYQVEEKLLPALPKLYVCGKVGSSNEITAPGWRSLLITGKTRDEYLGHAMQHAKVALIVAASLAGVGTILGVVGALTGGGSPEPTAKTTTAAPAPQAPGGIDTTTTVASAVPSDTAPPASTPAKPGTRPVASTAKPPVKPPNKKK